MELTSATIKTRPAKPRRHVGGCLCGAVRFEAIGPAGAPHTCSCRMCQRHTGALTAAWVEFPSESVTWTGTGGMPSVFRSSEFSSRAFCPGCGSTIGAIDDKPVIALLLGVFDKPGARELMPTYHSFRGGRPKWWHVEVASE
ncbi:GFA family protein [Mesorhizobium sp. PAMC28654]|uniref:GFA family protein n=1 Tax=Mesorhizobium sp. PAMC28654 TaxID=2880934 RepID=UPI001D0B6430|nr:GFA family protein [Mesorhizobium sp. PAMC28654]UDL89063.1 GFA family protein [Mesorhizobium sp. PAMC28654]